MEKHDFFRKWQVQKLCQLFSIAILLLLAVPLKGYGEEIPSL